MEPNRHRLESRPFSRPRPVLPRGVPATDPLKPQTPAAPPDFRPDLQRWQHLVTPAWLSRLLAGDPVAAPPSADWCLFEVGQGGPAAFSAGHIPGAAYLDTHRLEREPLWNKVSDRALLALLLESGVRHDTTVVLYGRNTLAAARAAHLMLYAGVRDVRLLDGGYAAWAAAGWPTAAGAPAPLRPVADFGRDFPAHPAYLIGLDEARQLLREPDGALVSIRSWSEFTGQTSGYDYIAARGEIPGARWGRAGVDGDVNSMADFQNPDGTMKPSAEIRGFWHAAGIRPEQRVAFYCGTGWRASLAFFYAWLMDWERIAVYDGGWLEWSRDAAHPVACGADCPN